MSLKNHPRRRGNAYVSIMSSPPFLFLNGHIPELSVQPGRNTCQQKLREVAEILVATEEVDACSIGSLWTERDREGTSFNISIGSFGWVKKRDILQLFNSRREEGAASGPVCRNFSPFLSL